MGDELETEIVKINAVDRKRVDMSTCVNVSLRMSASPIRRAHALA